jgi:hypothetical protein
MFADLPKPIQEQTRKAYRQFKEDPSYPRLRFKKERSDCLDCQGVTQKTIKELLSNLKSQARKKRSKN